MCNLFLWEVAGKIIGFSQDDELLWGIFHFIEDEKPRPRLIIDDGHESKLDWKSLSIFVKETNEVKVFCVTTSDVDWKDSPPGDEKKEYCFSSRIHRDYRSKVKKASVTRDYLPSCFKRGRIMKHSILQKMHQFPWEAFEQDWAKSV